MATHMLGNLEAGGVVAKNRQTAGSVAISGNMYANDANYSSLTSLDTRLLAIGGSFTQKVVDSMTVNDKIYAIRMNDDLGTI